jgi:hypothetical protein
MSCPTGKIPYATAVAAGRALSQHRRRGWSNRSYVCPHCRQWHVTSQPKRRKARA